MVSCRSRRFSGRRTRASTCIIYIYIYIYVSASLSHTPILTDPPYPHTIIPPYYNTLLYMCAYTQDIQVPGDPRKRADGDQVFHVRVYIYIYICINIYIYECVCVRIYLVSLTHINLSPPSPAPANTGMALPPQPTPCSPCRCCVTCWAGSPHTAPTTRT